MSDLIEAALEVQQFFRRRRWRFCIIGGLAVTRWGEPRTTQDVDVSLFTGFGDEEKFVDRLLSQFTGRIPNARQFALEHRVLLCQASNGVAVDVSLAALPFEEQIIARASRFRYAPKVTLVTASAEDLVVLKAFADRDKDWLDIRGVIARQRDKLDWELIHRELKVLCDLKDDPSPLEKLGALRRHVEQRLGKGFEGENAR
jgi:hypothetical protein